MNKVLTYAAVLVLGLPTGALAGSLTGSLIEGRTPEEAVLLLAAQVDDLFGRVAVLEETIIEQDVVIEEQRTVIEELSTTIATTSLRSKEEQERNAKLKQELLSKTRKRDEATDATD